MRLIVATLSVASLVVLSSLASGEQLPQADRQQRSLAGSGSASSNQLTSGNDSPSNGNSNVIEQSSSKSRIEQEKRQLQEFLTTKNIFKSIVKLLFGSQDEISATSRNVLSVMGKVLDLLKNTLGQKSRSGQARFIKDSAEDAASAGVSVLQGYVKSLLANDDKCVQRYLCQASREATRDGRDLGYVIATVGGYASSYLLDNPKLGNSKNLFEASKKGRSVSADCAKLYPECAE